MKFFCRLLDTYKYLKEIRITSLAKMKGKKLNFLAIMAIIFSTVSIFLQNEHFANADCGGNKCDYDKCVTLCNNQFNAAFRQLYAVCAPDNCCKCYDNGKLLNGWRW